MNRVQTVTQKHYRVEKPGQNQASCTSTKTGPASPAYAHRPHPGRACVAVSCAVWPCHGRAPRPCRRPAWLYRSTCRVHLRVACFARPPACSAPACAARQRPAQRLPSAHASCHNTTLLYCDTNWPSLCCNTPQPTKLYCNTIS